MPPRALPTSRNAHDSSAGRVGSTHRVVVATRKDECGVRDGVRGRGSVRTVPGSDDDHASRSVQVLAADRRSWIVLGLAFVVSRSIYALLGVRFDIAGLDYASQLVDPDLLQEQFLESLWYLHAQPPGFNFLVGGVLKLSPFSDAASLQVVYLAFGVVLVYGLYDLARQLRLSPVVSFVVTIVVACGPVVVLYENWLAYEYPVAVLLVLLADATARWVRNGRPASLAAVVGLAAVATLSRSLLHPVWLVAVVVLALAARRPKRWTWRPVVAVGLPLLLVAGVMVKNQVLFGSPELSSWFGFNIHKVTVDSLPVDVRDRLVAEGVISTDEPPDCDVDRADVAVLAEKFKRGWRGDEAQIRNFNYECLPPYFDDLADDAVAAARAEPGWAAKGVLGSFEVWAGPATFYPGIVPNQRRIDRVETVYRRTVLLAFPWDPPVALPAAWGVGASAPDERFHLSLTIVGATLLVLAGAAVVVSQWRRRGLGASRAAYLMGAGTVAFVTLAGNLFEHGENNRFRFIVEPLTLVLAVAVVAACVRDWRRRRDRPDLDSGSGGPDLTGADAR